MQKNAKNSRGLDTFQATATLTLLPLVLSLLLFFMRPSIFKAWCATNPSPCVKESVNSVDQIAFTLGSIRADFWSNVVQNGIGTLYFLIPFYFAIIRRTPWRASLQTAFVFIQVMLWNFVCMEIVRGFVQRPRPLVFADPMGDGANIHQYTSFYSGHTSFVALATTGLTLYLPMALGRPSLRPWLAGIAAALIVLTGVLRVWGGRHYPTDVIAGAFMGVLLAWIHRSRVRKHENESVYPSPDLG
jgi:membrane-associated phospholipid phosphatase